MLTMIVRTFIMFILVVVALRVMGKRQLGQLEPSEFVATIMMSELAALPMSDHDIPISHAILAVAVILLLEIIMAELVLRHIRLRQLFGGKPSTIIYNGRILKNELRKNRITIDELQEELRIKGVMDFSTVQFAVMEGNGALSVMLYPQHQPLTAAQFGTVPTPQGMPVIVISDGHWLDDNLRYLGMNRDYITTELAERKIHFVADIFLLMVDEYHNFFLYTQKDVQKGL